MISSPKFHPQALAVSRCDVLDPFGGAGTFYITLVTVSAAKSWCNAPASSCNRLYPRPRIQESQLLGPDPFLPRAREARGRFAKGSSGNPRGRPRGIPNPRRRVPDLAARQLGTPALSDLLDRKPHLLRLLAAQLLPPPLTAIDPAACLGIDLSSLRTVEDLRQVLATVLAGRCARRHHARRSRAYRRAGGCPAARGAAPRPPR